jgi:glycosyltransferase involved in cell wall biosynthesis
MELVSVIVPVYGVEKYLRRAVDALLGQTYENLQIILVDDGSPDGCGAICDEYAQRDGRVLALHQKNAGVSAARNAGLDAATGDWVAFCDGDDWFAADFVEKMLACAKAEAADFAVCDYRIVSERQQLIADSVAALESGCDSRLAVAVGPFASWNHLVRRALFSVRYPQGVRQYEELPVMPVLAARAKRIAVVKEPLYNYFQRGDGTSASNAGADTATQFRRAYNQMAQLLGGGFEKEAEYHAIYGLLYGEVLRLCKAKAPSGEIKNTIRAFEAEYPAWRENPYLPRLGRAKNLFLRLCSLRFAAALRLLAWAHSKLVN